MDLLRSAVLGLADAANRALDPFEEFTRQAQPHDGTPLGAKDGAFWAEIQADWLGGVDRELFWSMKPNDGGDMAIWHGVYVATCALRRDIAALDRALVGSQLLQGQPMFSPRLVRGADVPGGPLNRDPTRAYYRRRMFGSDYEVLADPSESTLIGHVFGLWAAHRWSGDEGHSNLASELLCELAEQVQKDGHRLLNPDGTPARFGDLRPGITAAPIRISALAMLYAAASAAGHSEFRGEVDRLERSCAGALSHPETHLLWVHPWYQDIIAYMAATVLRDARPSCPLYRDALASLWSKTRKEGNPFYEYLMRLVGENPLGGRPLASLQEFGAAKLKGTVRNSDSEPGKFRWGWSWAKGGQWLAKQPVPVWKRPAADFAWQRCPYSLDGSADAAYSGLDFCSAYWLGVRSGAIANP